MSTGCGVYDRLREGKMSVALYRYIHYNKKESEVVVVEKERKERINL